MRRNLLLLLLVFSSAVAVAQSRTTPLLEAFGGYSYLRTTSGDFGMNGWDGELALNLNRWFGAKADVSFSYFDESIFYPAEGGAPDRTHRAYGYNSHYLFGPTLSYRRERYALFSHTLFGLSHATQHNILTVPGGSAKFENSSNVFSIAVGGGIDINLNRRIAVRPVQVEYVLDRLPTAEGHYNLNRFRYSAGLVFRFGSSH